MEEFPRKLTLDHVSCALTSSWTIGKVTESCNHYLIHRTTTAIKLQ